MINEIQSLYSTEHNQQIRSLIAKHFIPSNDEKKRNAEVSTPVNLVDEMMDKIPLDFWKTPKKVLEPCCGKGNFILAIFDKFFNGLEEIIPDVIQRCYIIIDCIYFSDINPLNILISTELLKCHIRYYGGIEVIDCFHSNIGDSLKLNSIEKWGLEAFDAVIGNPPYNSPGKTATGNTIWQYFVLNSINILKMDGYLCFIHPNGWRKPNERSRYKELFKKMTRENIILYLEIHDLNDGKKVFCCGTCYDWYVLQRKINNNHKTIIVDQQGVKIDINLFVWNWLPNFNIVEIGKILLKDGEIHCNSFLNSSYDTRKKWVQEKETEEFKYPLIHSTLKNNVVRYFFTNDNTKSVFGISKVIFGESGINTPIIDMEGKYGTTQHAIGIVVENIEEAINVKNALMSVKFKDFLKACSWSIFRVDWRIFTYLRRDFWKDFS